MNTQELHIGIDLGTQELNTSVQLKLQSQAKDLYLNRSVRSIINEDVRKAQNTINNIATYEDIRSFYERLAPLIFHKELTQLSLGYRWQSFQLPSGTQSQLSSGLLEVGVEYRVVIAGTTDFRDYGYANATPVVGDTFTATNLVYGNYIIEDTYYKIKDNTGSPIYAYTLTGAADNNDDTVFKCNVTSFAFLPTNDSYCEIVTKPWSGGTILERVFTYDFDHLLSVTANEDKGASFKSGLVTAGKKYRVVTAGTTDLSAFGGTTVPVADDVFLCTRTGTPTWVGGTELILTEDYVCRVMKPQDIHSTLSHAYGTTYDVPIAEQAVSETSSAQVIRIYNNDTFSINTIEVVYTKKPDKINLVTSVDCNLNESIHDEVLARAIQLIKVDDHRLQTTAK